MPQSLSAAFVHLVWSTKDRSPCIHPEIRNNIHAYLSEAVRSCGCEAYRVGGVADHVHIALRLSRTITIADLVREIKTTSSKWIKSQYPSVPDFAWQKGYGAFTLGMSQLDQLIHYIENQETHHHTTTFQEEYRMLLKKYKVDFDERFVWD